MSRLFTDRKFGDKILANLHDSSADLRDILRKINNGQGSLGMAVNDPALYNNANSFLGGGWGIRLLNSIYGVTHPLAKTDSDKVPLTHGVADAEKPEQISASPLPA